MNRKIPNAAINAAAEWWTAQIDGMSKHDNGDRGMGSVFAAMLADTMMRAPSEKALRTFKNRLVMRLSEKAETGVNLILLESDYSPCPMLADCAKAADIPLENFPWKTSMHVSGSGVTASAGYGKGWTRIWPEAEFADESAMMPAT